MSEKKYFTRASQDGGVWNGCVCVGSVENVDFWKIKVESSSGKYRKEMEVDGLQANSGQTGKSDYGNYNAGDYNAKWKLDWQ